MTQPSILPTITPQLSARRLDQFIQSTQGSIPESGVAPPGHSRTRDSRSRASPRRPPVPTGGGLESPVSITLDNVLEPVLGLVRLVMDAGEKVRRVAVEKCGTRDFGGGGHSSSKPRHCLMVDRLIRSPTSSTPASASTSRPSGHRELSARRSKGVRPSGGSWLLLQPINGRDWMSLRKSSRHFLEILVISNPASHSPLSLSFSDHRH
jgi:hypothetical protein